MTIIFSIWVCGVFGIAAFWSCYWSGYHSGAAATYAKCRKDFDELAELGRQCIRDAEKVGAKKVIVEVKKIVDAVADKRLKESLEMNLFGETGGSDDKERLH